jgi:hypothetical protein
MVGRSTMTSHLPAAEHALARRLVAAPAEIVDRLGACTDVSGWLLSSPPQHVVRHGALIEELRLG